MNNKFMLIDIDKCVACYACEVACKQENGLPLTSRWCRVVAIGPRKAEGQVHQDFLPVFCNHCDDPICSYFCDFDAIVKGEDGVVLIDEEKCTGCGICVFGCPYGFISLDQGKKLAGKCSLCTNRTDNGLEPSCVQHCLSGALQFVTIDELGAITDGMHITNLGKIYYASSKWKLLLEKNASHSIIV